MKLSFQKIFIALLSTQLTAFLTLSPFQAIGNECFDTVETNSFRTDRSFSKYAKFLTPIGKSLYEYFKNLKNESVWIDTGAGQAIALKQGLSLFPNLSKALAIGVKKPEGFTFPINEKDKNRFEYKEGYLENLFDEGKLDHLKGKVNIITDVLGAFSYTRDLRKVLQIQIDLLAPGGNLFLMYYKDYNRVSGTEGKLLINWLKSIPGIEVSERKSGEFKYTSVVITKKSEKVIVPDNLIYGSDDRGVPPRRHFFWRK